MSFSFTHNAWQIPIKFVFVLLLAAVASTFAYVPVGHVGSYHLQRSSITRLNDATLGFLSSKDQKTYLTNVLRRSADCAAASLNDGNKLIEIAFPENRKNDLSVTESLDTNREYTKKFVKKFSSYGKLLWVVFPDKGELNLAAKEWGLQNSFTLASIDSAAREIAAGASPELMIVVNPGFNVEEWIQLAKIETSASIIIINGNLDRLRNGYYPWFFYPELTRVTDSFYRKFTQGFFVSPIAVGGDRFGAWLCKKYPEDWKLLVKGEKGTFIELQTYSGPPNPKDAWTTASKAFKDMRGSLF